MSVNVSFSPLGPCDFESGTCGYKDVSTGYYAWDRLKYSSNADQRYRGPVIDNTKRTADGEFILSLDRYFVSGPIDNVFDL